MRFAKAQAVRLRIVTAADRVRPQYNVYGVCGGKVGIRRSFVSAYISHVSSHYMIVLFLSSVTPSEYIVPFTV
jgi:hypothetical protein